MSQRNEGTRKPLTVERNSLVRVGQNGASIQIHDLQRCAPERLATCLSAQPLRPSIPLSWLLLLQAQPSRLATVLFSHMGEQSLTLIFQSFSRASRNLAYVVVRYLPLQRHTRLTASSDFRTHNRTNKHAHSLTGAPYDSLRGCTCSTREDAPPEDQVFCDSRSANGKQPRCGRKFVFHCYISVLPFLY
jgi:hypothetical protein